MTGLRDLLKKKDKIKESDTPDTLTVPEFKFIRSATGEVDEVVEPPDYPDQPPRSSKEEKRNKRHTLGFRKSSNAAETKDPTAQTARTPKPEKRLSDRLGLHIHGNRARSTSTSDHIPEDLPDAPNSVALPADEKQGAPQQDEKTVKEQREAQWEKRATILAHTNHLNEQTDGPAEAASVSDRGRSNRPSSRSRSRSKSLSTQKGDINIQEAIRLHEIGELRLSTAMFGRLADPKGENNALAQVLYGLALRHGWGYEPDPEKAIRYLSLAASNSANIEEQALSSGMKKGGAAKGELVLAIFELANCFRHGWGVKKDAVAARQYYETAANLGDTDAMDEAAWCYLEGFGGSKDKFKAAQYLRLAEKSGAKTVGNAWIWKDKYNPK